MARFLAFTVAFLFVAIFVATTPAFGQAPADPNWADALAERFGEIELAERIYRELQKSGTPEDLARASLGLARLARRRALSATGNDRLLADDRVLENARAAVLALPEKHPEKTATTLEWARMGLDCADDAIDYLGQTREDPARRTEVFDRTDRLLADISDSYAAIAKARANAAPDSAEWLIARRAELLDAIALMGRARLLATDEKERGSKLWHERMDRARRSFEDFCLAHGDKKIGLLGAIWLGKALGEYVGARNSTVSVADVESTLAGVADRLLGLQQKDRPLDPESQNLLQQAQLRLLEFLNAHGLEQSAIRRGESMAADWRRAGVVPNVFGRSAIVELARAYSAAGRYGDALATLNPLGTKKSDAARAAADDLAAEILAFMPALSGVPRETMLAAAESAFLAAGRDESRLDLAAELFRKTLALLPAEGRTDMERETAAVASFRLGQIWYQKNRRHEAAAVFESGYKDSWNADFPERPRLVTDLADTWRAVVREILRQEPKNPAARAAVDEAERWILSHPARGAAVADAGDVEFQKAEQEFANGHLAEAKRRFLLLAESPTADRERALLRLAATELKIARTTADATKEAWLAVVERFGAWRALNADGIANEEKRARRERILADVIVGTAEALVHAAERATDSAEKKKLYEDAVEETRDIDRRIVVLEQRPFAAQWRFLALQALERTADADRTLDDLFTDHPDHPVTADLSLRGAKAWRERAQKMPHETAADRAQKRIADQRAAECFRRWITIKRSPKLADWNAIAGLFYDLEDWRNVRLTLELALATTAKESREPAVLEVAERRLARAMLEEAKAEFLRGEAAAAERDAARAGELYDHVTEADVRSNRGSYAVAVESAEAWGGTLLTSPETGKFIYFMGAKRHAEAKTAWELAHRRSAASFAEGDDAYRLAERYFHTRLHVLLNAYAIIAADPAHEKKAEWLADLDSIEKRAANEPAGKTIEAKLRWLRGAMP